MAALCAIELSNHLGTVIIAFPIYSYGPNHMGTHEPYDKDHGEYPNPKDLNHMSGPYQT